jgi:hypothetical protein
LNGRERGNDLSERGVPDHDEVHVAGRSKCSRGGGSVDQGDADLRAKWFERSPDLVRESRSLQKDALELREDRACRGGLVEDLVSAGGASEDTGCRHLLEISGYGTLSDPGDPDQLSDVKRFVRVCEEPSEKTPAGSAEENRRRAGHARDLYRCTH